MSHDQKTPKLPGVVTRISEDGSVYISAPTRQLMSKAIDSTPGFAGAIHHTPKYKSGTYNAIVEILH